MSYLKNKNKNNIKNMQSIKKLYIYINFGKYISKLLPGILFIESFYKNELIFTIPSLFVEKVIYFLKNHTQSQFKMLSDICAVDFLKKEGRFEIIYNLTSIRYNVKIRIKTFVNEITPINTITNVFACANWWEREIWDLFGIFFSKHPDLRRILTDYSFKGHPLRKDFPLTGFLEVRYDHLNKCLISEPVMCNQKYRLYTFENKA
jgi:NADH/F420H2 dehydrogenase subunit C